ncbi:hypothetical protein BCS98_02575 [Vibrio breoganii]|uniref:DEAD/DEAH box helicase n=1 Tax=Vibrio breoganii TaxID=553239 RepID=UPI000C8384DB|nr:DEAD/DEAH box helicase [Vibrio breoganii]PML61741.1 hypothetical protein BCT73_01380 [Vibrio breoganii]PMO77411.1 hypothetical protein BCT00_01380 [Vibrio breoganii]PMO89319.1 hypothetical protein BCS98_02575 [Vibrio breoganii]
MLKSVLDNLSFSDKYQLMNDSQREFISALGPEERQNFDLSNMLFQTSGLRLLSDSSTANLIIDRMSEQQVTKSLNNINGEIGLVTEDISQYQLLKHLALYDVKLLFRALELSSAFDNFENLNEKVQAISQVYPSYPLYDYQLDCVNRVLNLVRDEDAKRVLLHLPTGAGKTRTALNVVCNYLRENTNKLVVWLADTKELCEQASEEFTKAWAVLGNRRLPVYSYYGDSELSISGLKEGFLVCGLQKLNSLEKNERDALAFLYSELRKHSSLVVFDEAHLSVAPTYKYTVEGFLNHSENDAFLLGLSATPGRVMGNDDSMRQENEKLSEFFDNNKVTMSVPGYSSPLSYLVENEYLAKAEFNQLKYDDIELSGFDKETKRRVNNSELLKALSKNGNRNKVLIDTIQDELTKDDAQIIVFACTVAHARELSMLLTGLSIACRSIDGDTPKFDRASAIQDFKNRDIRVLINYGVLTAGFDAPCTNVAIIARPTNSLVQYSQMVGRAMRGPRSAGNKTCRIYTVTDDIPEFRNVFQAFTYWDQMWKPE